MAVAIVIIHPLLLIHCRRGTENKRFYMDNLGLVPPNSVSHFSNILPTAGWVQDRIL